MSNNDYEKEEMPPGYYNQAPPGYYNQNAMNQNAMNQNAMNQNAMNQNAMNQNAMNQNARNQNAMNLNNLSGFSSSPFISKAANFIKSNPGLSYAATAYLGSRFAGRNNSTRKPDHAKLIAFVLIFLLVVLGISCGMYLTGAYASSEHAYADTATCSDQATRVYGDCAGVAQCLTCNGMKACDQ